MNNDKYELLAQQLQALIEGEPDLIANLSNASAAINEALENINWAGFYLVKENMLVLGPFQGKPACIRIPFGKGVCGTAAKKDETQLVKDVHEFPGHIACDSASRSEIVIPIMTRTVQWQQYLISTVQSWTALMRRIRVDWSPLREDS